MPPYGFLDAREPMWDVCSAPVVALLDAFVAGSVGLVAFLLLVVASMGVWVGEM